MIAVVKLGGKQYLIRPGQKILTEKIVSKKNKTIELAPVLLVAKDDKIIIGKPQVKEAKVLAKICQTKKSDKIKILKFKPKTGYKKTMGHRQILTQLEITKIEAKI